MVITHSYQSREVYLDPNIADQRKRFASANLKRTRVFSLDHALRREIDSTGDGKLEEIETSVERLRDKFIQLVEYLATKDNQEDIELVEALLGNSWEVEEGHSPDTHLVSTSGW